jgi:SAM-dependent methyltransferase
MNVMRNNVASFYRTADATRDKSQDDRERVGGLLPMLEPKAGTSFLDIGCYDGTKSRLLGELVGASRICGVDFLPERLQQAQRRGIDTHLVDLNADVRLPFGDGEFDFVFAGDVIEHLYSPDHLLTEVARLLSPGGYAILTTPNLASWRNRLVLLVGWQPFGTEVSTRYRLGNPFAPRGIPSGHIRVFVPRSLRELLERYGFEIASLRGLPDGAPAKGLISSASRFVDQVVTRFFPVLCDELVVKFRKR